MQGWNVFPDDGKPRVIFLGVVPVESEYLNYEGEACRFVVLVKLVHGELVLKMPIPDVVLASLFSVVLKGDTEHPGAITARYVNNLVAILQRETVTPALKVVN